MHIKQWDPFNIAIEDYSEAIALNSNDINYYHTRGDAYYNIKEYPKALHDFNAIIILNPKDASMH